VDTFDVAAARPLFNVVMSSSFCITSATEFAAAALSVTFNYQFSYASELRCCHLLTIMMDISMYGECRQGRGPTYSVLTRDPSHLSRKKDPFDPSTHWLHFYA